MEQKSIRKIGIRDSIGGLQVVSGKPINDCLSVRKITGKRPVVLNGTEIDHIYLHGNFMLLELKNKTRMSFYLKVNEQPEYSKEVVPEFA